MGVKEVGLIEVLSLFRGVEGFDGVGLGEPVRSMTSAMLVTLLAPMEIGGELFISAVVRKEESKGGIVCVCFRRLCGEESWKSGASDLVAEVVFEVPKSSDMVFCLASAGTEAS